MHWYADVIRRYADFDGRSDRPEFWWFGLINLMVEIRRLHDTNRSGWWILMSLIPVIGAIILIVFFASAATHGPNRFGPQLPPRVAA